MCGGYSLLDLLTRTSSAAVTVQPDVRQEVKRLHALGSIDTPAFHRLMHMAENGYLQVEDIPALIPNPPDARKIEGSVAIKTSDEWSERERQIIDLESEISRLINAAQQAETRAKRRGITAEETAAYLEMKQGAMFRAEALKPRLQALREGL